VIPAVLIVVEAPVWRRPQRAYIGGDHPSARCPVVTRSRGVRPVTGRPDIVIARTGWLRIFRQRRRCIRGLYRLLIECRLILRILLVVLGITGVEGGCLLIIRVLRRSRRRRLRGSQIGGSGIASGSWRGSRSSVRRGGRSRLILIAGAVGKTNGQANHKRDTRES